MRILITGAGGMLGQDVRAAALAAGHDPIGLARAQLDIADADAVSRAMTDARPDAVINCAAWTKVDAAEEHEPEATAANGAGAGHVARAAASVGAWTIHVSSDYVFDGSKRSPYLESRPDRPAVGVRSLQARRRAGGCVRRAARAHDRAVLVAVRRRRSLLSEDDAAAGGRA